MTDKSEAVAQQASAKAHSAISQVFQPHDAKSKESKEPVYPQLPQIPDFGFALGDRTEIKTWLFNEWFIPPIGSGRTIIDLWWQPKLTLVRTTSVGGGKVLYIAIETNIRVWNPFVAGHEAVLSATILDVGQNFVFGSFPSGCGITTWVVRNVGVKDDIFDVANTAQLNMSGFSFFYC